MSLNLVKNMNPTLPGKQIVFLSMLYMSLFFASTTVGYKIIIFGNEIGCASIFIFPLLFPLSDALAEIYGSEIAKSMVWYTIICEAIFVFLTKTAIMLPSPSSWHHQAEYDFLIGGYTQILIANSTALFVSFYLNVHFISKWRTILKGKHFYLRSLGATAIGEITYTVITNVIAYYHVLTWKQILNLMIFNYGFKLVYSIVLAYPAALFVAHTKLKYKTNNQTSNPFEKFDSKKVIDFSDYKARDYKRDLI